MDRWTDREKITGLTEGGMDKQTGEQKVRWIERADRWTDEMIFLWKLMTDVLVEGWIVKRYCLVRQTDK